MRDYTILKKSRNPILLFFVVCLIEKSQTDHQSVVDFLHQVIG